MMARRHHAAALLLAALLAGCGGGGDAGGDPFDPPTADFDAFAAWQNLVDPAAAISRQVSGDGNDGLRYSATLSLRVLADAVFVPLGGDPFLVTELRSSLSQAGTVQEINAAELYFDQADWKVYGLRRIRTIPTGLPQQGTTTTCDIVTTNAVPPTAVKVNSSGVLYDASIRDGCGTTSTEIGTSRGTWSLEWEGFSATVLFCVTIVDRGLGSSPVQTTDESCFEVRPNGALASRARTRVTVAGNAPSNFIAVMDNY